MRYCRHNACQSGYTCRSTTGNHKRHLVALFETKERSKSDINVMNIYINVRPADQAMIQLDSANFSFLLQYLQVCEPEQLKKDQRQLKKLQYAVCSLSLFECNMTLPSKFPFDK